MRIASGGRYGEVRVWEFPGLEAIINDTGEEGELRGVEEEGEELRGVEEVREEVLRGVKEVPGCLSGLVITKGT